MTARKRYHLLLLLLVKLIRTGERQGGWRVQNGLRTLASERKDRPRRCKRPGRTGRRERVEGVRGGRGRGRAVPVWASNLLERPSRLPAPRRRWNSPRALGHHELQFPHLSSPATPTVLLRLHTQPAARSQEIVPTEESPNPRSKKRDGELTAGNRGRCGWLAGSRRRGRERELPWSCCMLWLVTLRGGAAAAP